MNELLLTDDLHRSYRNLVNIECELTRLLKSDDANFISDESDTILAVVRYILRNHLTEEQLGSNAFIDWFFQKDTSIFQIMEDLEQKEEE